MPFGIYKVLDHFDIDLSLTVWAWWCRKAVGGKGWVNELIDNEAVCRPAPGFAQVCLRHSSNKNDNCYKTDCHIVLSDFC